ncbi:N-acetylmuramoyl-L-alanine amidase [Candidatus Finniella inopinata]|uniref:N-acetylmuramoyl-L-alanine amidase n=1 Tax=Candidatus Finniella inopinata TaxID=1696036 RepID=A0A4Q7DJX4_9PROT|nr:N-acetylmuramoyl-L-alanine amidase [Candidatus Finniella inopinata]RZI46579.1 N-acetylmuramoyl-L-alanine amidase [Candidatus Finniella inopinata]
MLLHPSPNFDDRPLNTIVDTIVIHYTNMSSATVSLQRLCDPLHKVSSHYLIDQDGTIYQLVAEEKRAWHAGESIWQGRPRVNDFSIGIELHNPGDVHFLETGAWHPYPDTQYQALLSLLKDIATRHPLVTQNTVGHCHIAPARKIDPGPHFDWDWLARKGFTSLLMKSDIGKLVFC